MTYINVNNKKYLIAIPILFGALTLSGVMGIISTSLAASHQTNIIADNSSSLAPGNFEITPIPFDPSWSALSIKIDVLDFDLDNSIADFYLVSDKPTNNFENNFTQYKNSVEYDENVIEQKLSVTNINNIFVLQNYDTNGLFHLLMVNPSNSDEPISKSIIVTISEYNTSGNASNVLAIIGAAMFTLGMLIMTIFTSIEIAEPDRYKAKILTTELNLRVEKLLKEAESWENIIIAMSFVFLPIGVAMNFASVNNSLTFFCFAGIIGVYYNINRRIEFHRALLSILEMEREIRLTDLASRMNKKDEDIKKAIFYLISHKRYPIQYNVKTDVIVYSGETPIKATENPLTQTVTAEEPLSPETSKVRESVEEIVMTCAYCGAEAIVPEAKFCAECGSSMVATK